MSLALSPRIENSPDYEASGMSSSFLDLSPRPEDGFPHRASDATTSSDNAAKKFFGNLFKPLLRRQAVAPHGERTALLGRHSENDQERLREFVRASVRFSQHTARQGPAHAKDIHWDDPEVAFYALDKEVGVEFTDPFGAPGASPTFTVTFEEPTSPTTTKSMSDLRQTRNRQASKNKTLQILGPEASIAVADSFSPPGSPLSPSSPRSLRRTKAASRMKTLQLLGPEATAAIEDALTPLPTPAPIEPVTPHSPVPEVPEHLRLQRRARKTLQILGPEATAAVADVFSPPASPVVGCADALKIDRRARWASRMKTLELLGPEAGDAVAEKWDKENC